MSVSLAALAACSPKATTVPHLVTEISSAQRIDSNAHAAITAQAKIDRLKANYFKKSSAQLKSSSAKTHAAFADAKSPVVASTITFAKKAILDRDFLFGTDLQYSSISQMGDMFLQSMAVGHAVARFQVFGDKLQLMAQEKYRFESNINIPLQLIHEWPIIASSADSFTVKIEKGSALINGLFGPGSSVRNNWVRSVSYVADGDYLMIESSAELADGSVAELMESLFPRETLVKNNTQPIFAHPALNPLASRFGFLADAIWLNLPNIGRVQVPVASRFAPPAAGETINWYVTPNVPDEFLPAIRDGVEGWNRYSQKMWGRDFIRFKGVLPAGVKIGDPRYNVVNWDSVVDASAAYESQATDPETGIQSHSLIYLPYAWVAIGQEFWNTGSLTEDLLEGKSDEKTEIVKAALSKIQFLGKSVSPNCINDGAKAIRSEMVYDADTFAKELLKGVLFHEVGHALGLAHNFKGSLEWDPDDENSMFSSSAMEYNQYQLEGQAFDRVSTETQKGSTGPLLEYDRQILSALYNEGKDISSTDRVVAHCADREASAYSGGIDPFCVPYDAGKDPSVVLQKVIALTQDPTAKLGKTKSLVAALQDLQSLFPNPQMIIMDQQVAMLLKSYQTKVLALTQYYVGAGPQSINYVMLQSLRALQVFRANTLPTGMDELALRIRVADSMDQMMKMEAFSAQTHKGLDQVGDEVAKWLRQTPWYLSATADIQKEAEETLRQIPAESVKMVEGTILPRLRTKQLEALLANPNAPFFLAPQADYEAKALEWIGQTLTGRLPSGGRYTVAERLSAAKSLATFQLNLEADRIKKDAINQVMVEMMNIKTAQERQELRALLSLLKS